jgi:hypothetical protein
VAYNGAEFGFLQRNPNSFAGVSLARLKAFAALFLVC